MSPYLGQSTQAQVWLDVQFSDFRMLAGMKIENLLAQSGSNVHTI